MARYRICMRCVSIRIRESKGKGNERAITQPSEKQSNKLIPLGKWLSICASTASSESVRPKDSREWERCLAAGSEHPKQGSAKRGLFTVCAAGKLGHREQNRVGNCSKEHKNCWKTH